VSLDKKFSLANVAIQEEQTAYQGFFRIKKFLLKHALFRGGDSGAIGRELFCRGDSVAVLLYDPLADRVGLVKQFRIGCLDNEHGPWVWEVIAGVRDKTNESTEEAVIREVMEESGISLCLENLVPICRYYSSPGGSDERLQLYCAMSWLGESENIFGLANEHEDILFKTFSYQEAIGAMLSGTINNAATIIALQWLQFNHDRLKGKDCITPGK
jgi:ADP-ribose pyrophosphatase